MEWQCPKCRDILLNRCDMCDIEWMDNEGEGGCGSALMSPMMLDEKAKKPTFEGREHSISWKKSKKTYQRCPPYPGKVLLNSDNILT